jgi:hypothetical protein
VHQAKSFVMRRKSMAEGVLITCSTLVERLSSEFETPAIAVTYDYVEVRTTHRDWGGFDIMICCARYSKKTHTPG